MDENELKEKIVDLVAQRWMADKSPLLLAQLGQMFAQEGIDLRPILKGRRMRSFISAELNDRLQIIQSPTDKLVQGVVPLEVAAEGEAAFRSVVESQSVKPVAPRYHPRFWLAFLKQMRPDQIRIINLTDPITFRDVAEGAETPSGEYVIRAKDLISDENLTKSERDAKTLERIREWLQANGVHEAVVLAKPRDSKPQFADCLLFALLDALEDSELKRVALPLDIVRKLRDVPVGR